MPQGCRNWTFIAFIVTAFLVVAANPELFSHIGALTPVAPANPNGPGDDYGPGVQNAGNQNGQGIQPGPLASGAAPSPPDIPEISPRLYTGGNASASVSGDFDFSGQLAVDTHASYTSRHGLSWIAFSDPGNPQAGDILVVFGEPENSVAVSTGTTVAIGRDAECDFDIHVTESSVAGSVSCASVEVEREGQPGGTSSIHLEFSTTTAPNDDG